MEEHLERELETALETINELQERLDKIKEYVIKNLEYYSEAYIREDILKLIEGNDK